MSVHDTGAGIPADRMDELFQPFNRLGREASDVPGAGIGLAVSRRLAEAMGGRLEPSSRRARARPSPCACRARRTAPATIVASTSRAALPA